MRIASLLVVLFCTVSCSSDVSVKQPSFPQLGKYWVIDNGCNFDSESVRLADEVFEKLRQGRIAEVAVVCQKGIRNNGPMDDDKIWVRDWGRHVKLGDVKENRAVVWLIRPDVKPEEHRVAITVSEWLYWYTAIDYREALEEAASYANSNDFSGALDSIARNNDSKLRERWKTHR